MGNSVILTSLTHNYAAGSRIDLTSSPLWRYFTQTLNYFESVNLLIQINATRWRVITALMAMLSDSCSF